MQTGILKNPDRKTLSCKAKTNIKFIMKESTKNAVTYLCSETAVGMEDIAVTFTEIAEGLERQTFELNLTDLKISSQAEALYYMLEKERLTSKYLLEKFTLNITDGRIREFFHLDFGQQQRVILEIGTYLRNNVRILTILSKGLRLIFIVAKPIVAAYLIYRIFSSENSKREACKIILESGSEFLVGLLGSKIGALLGTFGGPIGVVVGSIVGGIIGGVIGYYFGKGLFKLARKYFCPKSVGGPGQPPIGGAEYSKGQPYTTGSDTVFGPPSLGYEMDTEPKLLGADEVFGTPKLW